MTFLSRKEITNMILSDINSSQGSTVSHLSKSFVKILAIAYAGGLSLLFRLAQWLEPQIFTQTMGENALIRRGEQFGLSKTPAKSWIGMATATGTDSTIIPAGTLWSSSGRAYSTIATVRISGGITSLIIESLEKGEALNLSNGTLLQITSPIDGLDKIAMVTATTQSGTAEETTEFFRSRILNRQQTTPRGGSYADWIFWATEVSGIGEAFVSRPGDGFVNVYPITDETDPADRIPDSALIAIVQAYLEDNARCPIRAAAVTVITPTEIEFDVDITGVVTEQCNH